MHIRQITRAQIAWAQIAWAQIAWAQIAWAQIAWAQIAWAQIAWAMSAALLVGAIPQSVAGRAPPPLVNDGGFEKPATAPDSFMILRSGERIGEWRVVGPGGTVTQVSTFYTHGGFQFYSHSGLQWMNLAGLSSTATGVVHEPISTTPGASYDITFWVGNIVDPGGIYGTSSTVQVFVDGTLIGTATNGDGAGQAVEVWDPFTYTFTATNSMTTITFMSADPPNDLNCGLDDVSVTPLGS
jgi:hypothetical protein